MSGVRASALVALAGLGAGASSVGCLGARSIERSYYMLEGLERDVPTLERAMPGRIYVRDFETERVYDKFKLVVRKSPYVIQYSGSHSWAVRPNRMISDLVAEALDQSGAFASVTRQLAEGRPDYTMTGVLRGIEVFTESSPWRARLALDLELVRFDDGRVLWRYQFNDTRPIPQGNLDAVPEAVSQVLHVSLRRGLSDLIAAAERIRREPPPPGARPRRRDGAAEPDS